MDGNDCVDVKRGAEDADGGCHRTRVNETKLSGDLKTETNTTVEDEEQDLDTVEIDVDRTDEGDDSSDAESALKNETHKCDEANKAMGFSRASDCSTNGTQTMVPPHPPPQLPPPVPQSPPWLPPPWEPPSPPSPPPEVLVRFSDESTEQGQTSLVVPVGEQRNLSFTGTNPPQDGDRITYLALGYVNCPGAASNWRHTGMQVVANSSTTLPTLPSDSYKLCQCQMNSDRTCDRMDKSWRDLGLDLHVMTPPPPPPPPPPQPEGEPPSTPFEESTSNTTAHGSSNPLLFILVYAFAAALAMVAIILSRRWWKQRTTQRKRLPTYQAFAKEYDCFLSYRVASEVALVEALYHKLTAAGLKVWWDKRCLRPAQKWEDGFVDGMLSSVVIVPVLSSKLLGGFERLKTASPCDNVLLEHTLALEWMERGEVKGIFPLMVGERTPSGDYQGFFAGKAGITLPELVIPSVTTKLRHHLKRAKKGTPLSKAATASTIPEVLQELLAYQGTAMTSDDDAALDTVTLEIVRAVSDVRAGRPVVSSDARQSGGSTLTKRPAVMRLKSRLSEMKKEGSSSRASSRGPPRLSSGPFLSRESSDSLDMDSQHGRPSSEPVLRISSEDRCSSASGLDSPINSTRCRGQSSSSLGNEPIELIGPTLLQQQESVDPLDMTPRLRGANVLGEALSTVRERHTSCSSEGRTSSRRMSSGRNSSRRGSLILNPLSQGFGHLARGQERFKESAQPQGQAPTERASRAPQPKRLALLPHRFAVRSRRKPPPKTSTPSHPIEDAGSFSWQGFEPPIDVMRAVPTGPEQLIEDSALSPLGSRRSTGELGCVVGPRSPSTPGRSSRSSSTHSRKPWTSRSSRSSWNQPQCNRELSSSSAFSETSMSASACNRPSTSDVPPMIRKLSSNSSVCNERARSSCWSSTSDMSSPRNSRRPTPVFLGQEGPTI